MPSSRTRDIALEVAFAGFVAALGLVPAFALFGFPVPVTLQTLGVMITGAILGGRRAFVSLVIFLALVALGLPLLAGGRGGLAVFAGPSAGFLLAFPVGAYVIGALVYRLGAPFRTMPGFVAMVIGGIVVVYAMGIPVLAWRAGLSLGTAASGSMVFLIGDLAKAAVATVVVAAVHRGYPGLLPSRAVERQRFAAPV
ncbi:MAG: biotin transporter BioY [Nostocoides sp.]